MPKQEWKYINKSRFKPDIYERMIRDANNEGEDIDYYSSVIAERYYAMVDKSNYKITPEMEEVLERQEAERIQRGREFCFWFAANVYVPDSSIENAEKLKKYCDTYNVDYEEVIQQAKTDAFSSFISEERNSTETSQCARIIMQMYSKAKRSVISAKEFGEMRQDYGFSDKVWRKARQRINEDNKTPYIVTRRNDETKMWEYALMTEDDELYEFPHDDGAIVQKEFDIPERFPDHDPGEREIPLNPQPILGNTGTTKDWNFEQFLEELYEGAKNRFQSGD